LGEKDGVRVSASTVKPSPILQDSIMTFGTGKAPRITTFIVEDKTILENGGIRKIQDVLIYLPGTLAKDDDGQKVTDFSKKIKLYYNHPPSPPPKKDMRRTCVFKKNFRSVDPPPVPRRAGRLMRN
jgi:hypothetical protein